MNSRCTLLPRDNTTRFPSGEIASGFPRVIVHDPSVASNGIVNRVTSGWARRSPIHAHTVAAAMTTLTAGHTAE
jgi:hypothetical protein